MQETSLRRVLDESQARGVARLTLAALAFRADYPWGGIMPERRELRRLTCTSNTSLVLALQRLQRSGELTLDGGSYEICVPGRALVVATPGQLAERAAFYGGRCYLCGAEWEEYDHVKPRSRGGSELAANVRPACSPCNRAKGNSW